MNIWDPFHPIAYFLHTSLGVAGIIGAIVALSLTKGSPFHIRAGRTFAIAAAVAAATAIAFSFTSFAPMAVASGVMTLSAVGSAFLALRSKSPRVTASEMLTTSLMAFVLIWLLAGVAMSVRQGGVLWIPPLILACFPAALLVNDVRFMRLDDIERKQKRLHRHLSRMAFAFAIAVHAPVVVFADDLNIHPGLAFYCPFLIWPVIVLYFRARMRKGLYNSIVMNRLNVSAR
ncbi:MAG TPA: hypothetical protein VGA68_04710 [Woeseiaceae bacterium]